MRLFIRGAYPTRAKIRPPHVWLHASVVATPHNVERLKRLRLPQGLPSGSSKPDFFATTPRIVGNLWQSAPFLLNLLLARTCLSLVPQRKRECLQASQWTGQALERCSS